MTSTTQNDSGHNNNNIKYGQYNSMRRREGTEEHHHHVVSELEQEEMTPVPRIKPFLERFSSSEPSSEPYHKRPRITVAATTITKEKKEEQNNTERLTSTMPPQLPSRTSPFETDSIQKVLTDMNQNMMGTSSTKRRIVILEVLLFSLQRGLEKYHHQQQQQQQQQPKEGASLPTSLLSPTMDQQHYQHLVSTARPIQNILILHWGYALTVYDCNKVKTTSSSNNDNDNRHDGEGNEQRHLHQYQQRDAPKTGRSDQEVISLLCQCLQTLYKYFPLHEEQKYVPYHQHSDNVVNKAEFEDVVGLLIQTLEIHDIRYNEDALVACLDIISHLTALASATTTIPLQTAKSSSRIIEEIETTTTLIMTMAENTNLLLSLTKIIAMNKQQHRKHAMNILQTLRGLVALQKQQKKATKKKTQQLLQLHRHEILEQRDTVEDDSNIQCMKYRSKEARDPIMLEENHGDTSSPPSQQQQQQHQHQHGWGDHSGGIGKERVEEEASARKIEIVFSASQVIVKGLQLLETGLLGSSKIETILNHEILQKKSNKDENDKYYVWGLTLLRSKKYSSDVIHEPWKTELKEVSSTSTATIAQEILLFIRCLSYCYPVAERLVRCQNLLDTLYQLAMDPQHNFSNENKVETLSGAEASELLSMLATNLGNGTVSSSSQIYGYLVNIVCNGPCVFVRLKAARGLYEWVSKQQQHPHLTSFMNLFVGLLISDDVFRGNKTFDEFVHALGESVLMAPCRGDKGIHYGGNSSTRCHCLHQTLGITDNGELEDRLEALKLMSMILHYTSKRQSHFQEEYQCALNTIVCLILESSPLLLEGPLVQVAVSTIYELTLYDNNATEEDFEEGGEERHASGNICQRLAREQDVLQSLGHILSNEFSSLSSKVFAAKAMWNLAQDRTNLQILPRCPIVLDALVGVASSVPGTTGITTTTTRIGISEFVNDGDEDNEIDNGITGQRFIHDEREEIRRLSLKILVEFSTLACNRRVLARQVGLLSCLIRFVRTLDDTEEEFEKEGMKEKILKLAVLL